MQRLARDYAIMVTAAAIVFFTNLGGPRLWDRDEPRNAGCAREMLAAGDWVTPVFNAELRDHKPVLLYWLMMTAYAVFGVNEFSARFWSAALAVGTVLATYHIGRRLVGARVGLWAGVILSTSLMFDLAARAATPDSVLIFFATLPILVYVLATFAPQADDEDMPGPRLRVEGRYFPTGWPIAVLMYGLMGMAVLAKGPVGLVLPTAVIGMFLLIVTLPKQDGGRWWLRALRPFAPLHFLRTCWSMRPLTALAAAGAVALPWYVWVHIRTDGAWTEGFFLTHNVGRATSAMEGHDGSIFFYPLAILVGFFPWSVFAAPILIHVVRKLRQEGETRWGYVFAACWVGVYVGLFSLASTKLPSYITPMYPGLALLGACFVHQWTRGAAEVSPLWPRLALGALALVGATITIAVPLAARQFVPGEEWLGAIGLLPLGAAAACFYLLHQGKTLLAAQTFAVSAVLLTTTVFGYATVRADRHQQSDRLLAAIAAHSDQPQIGALSRLEPSWVFYAGRPIRPLDKSQLTDAADGVFAPGREGFVITTREVLESLQVELPAGVQVLSEAPYFLKDERLIVLGRPDRGADPVAATARRAGAESATR